MELVCVSNLVHAIRPSKRALVNTASIKLSSIYLFLFSTRRSSTQFFLKTYSAKDSASPCRLSCSAEFPILRFLLRMRLRMKLLTLIIVCPCLHFVSVNLLTAGSDNSELNFNLMHGVHSQ
jgi:hypothetical protein